MTHAQTLYRSLQHLIEVFATMESLDLLLERYLGLLDEYQTMKTRLHDDLAAVSDAPCSKCENSCEDKAMDVLYAS